MPQQQHNINASQEAQIQFALQALEQDANLSQRRAAAIYNVPLATLSDRRAGRPSRADTMPNSRVLDNNEEQVIVNHILELDAYDYKRALCEDSGVMQGWFNLVANVKAKYGIPDDDVHNFDETGFMIGQISIGAVVTASERRGRPKAAIPPFIIFKARHHLTGWYKEEDLPQDWVIGVSSNGRTTNELGFEWLKHFDRHTKERTVSTYRLLVIDGHESHKSLQFQQYCKDNKIVTLSEMLMRNWITYLTKSEFLPCFKAAYNAVFTPSNIQGGFRGAGLVPFDPERVISGLDVKLRTPSPPLAANNVPWQSQTPSNTLEFRSQSTLVKSRIQRHVDSSPTSIVKAFEKVSKGAAIIAHKLVLAQQEIRELRAANEAATRRKSHKRKRVQEEGTLIVEDGQRLAALKEFRARSDGKRAKKQMRAQEGEPSQRRCRRCNQTGHNARTCKVNVEEVSK
ncbi:hypothetical protein OPT61_g9425 [Boeremia exigua]|uniref:Uncharacterized protein n=1 Tax=Boeremia exigua TaxID=749465 RepID=A0ACC2HVR1_9PLEO|nr:hypothetical protein OPT61_g9425 [Boeremia exigua]